MTNSNSKYTDFAEANAMLAITVNDEEGARIILDTMSDWELRQLAYACSRLEWMARAMLDLRDNRISRRFRQ